MNLGGLEKRIAHSERTRRKREYHAEGKDAYVEEKRYPGNFRVED